MSQQDIVDTLIAEQGTLFSEAIGADIARDTPQEWFAWLEGTLLLSARIDHDLATRAAKAMREAGFHKIENLVDANEADIIACLGDNGYKRYREVAAGYLIETAAMVRDRYDGDLRKMLDDDPDAATVLERIEGAKGIGTVGAHIFVREAQLVWDLFYPTLDDTAAEQARNFGLTDDHGALVAMAGSRERFVRLVAALSRAAIGEANDSVSEAVQANR